MKKSTVIVTAILAVILMLSFGFLLYVGGSTVYYYTDGLMEIVYDALFFSMGIMIAIAVIPALISDISRYRKKKIGKRELWLSLGALLVGVFMTGYGIAVLLILFLGASLLNEILGGAWNMEEILFSIMRVIHWFFAVPAALYLIIAPIVRMIRTKHRSLQYRVEIYKPVLGVVLLILTLLNSVVVQLQRPTGTIIEVLGFALSAFAVGYLIAALAGLSKAVKAARQREEQAAQDAAEQVVQGKSAERQPLDLPFNLPAGVNPDDL
ncbi:MAG: hypothetical protein IJW70_06855 [Clostridia bacterium]|nr:hypothetical protein [Clostridia bacterium]